MPVRMRASGRGERSSASSRSLKWVSKPSRIVGRSRSIRPRISSGSKVSVSTCRAPVTIDMSIPSENPKR